MRFLILFVISILTSSCGVIQCVDSQFERKSIPIKGESVFEVTFSDGDIKSHVIKCEKYYSAICASRGNSWKVREVGKAGSLKRSYFSVLIDSYEIELPTCRQLTYSNSKITMDDISIVWNKEGVETMQTDSGTITSWLGKRFHYVSSTNGIHKFKTGGYGDEPLEIVEFEFDLKLNGIRLD